MFVFWCPEFDSSRFYFDILVNFKENRNRFEMISYISPWTVLHLKKVYFLRCVLNLVFVEKENLLFKIVEILLRYHVQVCISLILCGTLPLRFNCYRLD